MVKCVTCGATYEPILSDGMLYFHACAPLTKLRVKLLDTTIAVVDPPLPIGATLIETLAVDRPNARDENVPSTREEDHGKVKADGLGVATF